MESKEMKCPICCRLFTTQEIDYHVNKCIFLNSASMKNNQQHKRKRSPSPTSFTNTQKFPIEETSLQHRINCMKATSCNEVDVNIVRTNEVFSFSTPLTEQLQPKSLKEIVGQNHVIGENTFLRSLLNENELPNLILWGPPGCGKTSLANVISEMCKKNVQYKFVYICAVNCGSKEVRDIITRAKKDLMLRQRTVVFMDEIHRFNKRQQNSFLIPVKRGDIVLIGATTENPSFTLNNSLLDHCKVVVMEKLETPFLTVIIERALNVLNISILDDENTIRNYYQTNRICIHRSAVKWLADTSDGDARIALNNLQLIVQHNRKKKVLTIADIKDQIKKSHQLYDRNGEEHHNIISAMHESIKGYNENATLYWTARMIVGGEDPLFIARRLVRASSEDTGNADPNALRLAVSTMRGCQFLGMPDADVLLAQCALYLARAPTYKQSISALTLAKQTIAECREQQPPVPVHLRNIPFKLLKKLDDDDEQQTQKSFMPAGLENVSFL